MVVKLSMNFPLLNKGGGLMGEYEFLIGLISNTGFPIVAFLLIFWKFDKSLGLKELLLFLFRVISFELQRMYIRQRNYFICKLKLYALF